MSEFGRQINDPGSEIFFRVTDRLQMESCLSALAQDSRSVVIYSSSSELLDYYGAAFVRRVKQKLANTQVEIFMPRDTEAMLDRFNKLLNVLSLDVATASRAGQAPEKVWVVYDANALGAHELQLLTRLVQQFPGAGISIVLMFASQTAENEDVTRPNKQFVTWGLDLPTPEQKLTAIQEARKNGKEEEAVQFFNRLTKAATKNVPAFSTVEAVATPRRAETQVAKKKSSVKIWPWALGVGSLLAFSLGTALWLNPDVMAAMKSQASALLDAATGQSKPKTVAAVETPAPPAEPAPAENADKLAAKDEANNPMPPAASVAAPVAAPAAETEKPVVSETKVASPPVAPPASAVAPAPVKEMADDKVITELPDVAIKGRQWLRKLPEDSFVLVHKSFTRLKDAQAYMRNKDWLVNARIVPVFSDGKDEARFAVVTGFFRSKERAKTTIERLGLSADVAVMAVPVAVSQAVPKNTKP
jgi:hypothetical protein